jgi:hypothetical protein
MRSPYHTPCSPRYCDKYKPAAPCATPCAQRRAYDAVTLKRRVAARENYIFYKSAHERLNKKNRERCIHA